MNVLKWVLPLLCLSACPAKHTEPGKRAAPARTPEVVKSAAPAATPATTKPAVSRPRRLVYIPGSTRKLEQIVDDFDKHLQQRTRNQTRTRYRLAGADLGSSFEHKGKVILLFGDTIGRGGGDSIAHSTTTDPHRGLDLTFYQNASGGYLRVMPEGELMRGFEVPVAGISINGKPYIFCKREHTRGGYTDHTSLVLFDEAKGTFKTLRSVSRLPLGKFIKVSAHLSPEGMSGLPAPGPHVLIWGSAKYRRSDCYLSCVEVRFFERSDRTRYFAGLDTKGAPRWSHKEAEARPVVEHPTIGDVSVTWSRQLKLWLMTYDSRDPRGLIFRYSATPWGPWSEAQIIFNARRDRGLGHFIHQRGAPDGLAGPVIGRRGRANPGAVQGGSYAPYVIERFTRVRDNKLAIYYVLSTWNPYVVVLMRSEFKIL